MDADHFKRINDKFGHIAGDAVLQDIVMRLERAATQDGMVSRIGGDELTIIWPATFTEAKIRQQSEVLSVLSLAEDIRLLHYDLVRTSAAHPVRLAIDTPDQTCGLHYVLLGSRFGVRHIHRLLQASLPDLPHYFLGVQMNSSSWQSLLGHLERFTCDRAAIADIVKGAGRTFDGFNHTMQTALTAGNTC